MSKAKDNSEKLAFYKKNKIIIDKYNDGYKIKEISELTSLNISSVKSKIYRGIAFGLSKYRIITNDNIFKLCENIKYVDHLKIVLKKFNYTTKESRKIINKALKLQLIEHKEIDINRIKELYNSGKPVSYIYKDTNLSRYKINRIILELSNNDELIKRKSKSIKKYNPKEQHNINEKVIEYYNNGKSISEISEILKLKYIYIYLRIRRLSKKGFINYNKKSVSSCDDEVLKLYRQGYSVKEISETINNKISTVYNSIYRLRKKGILRTFESIISENYEYIITNGNFKDTKIDKIISKNNGTSRVQVTVFMKKIVLEINNDYISKIN